MNFSVYELTVDVSIVVNELAEDDKTFSVEVSLISPSSRVIIAPISAQVTIIDDNSTFLMMVNTLVLPHSLQVSQLVLKGKTTRFQSIKVAYH